jgi:hypothetical protein
MVLVVAAVAPVQLVKRLRVRRLALEVLVPHLP